MAPWERGLLDTVSREALTNVVRSFIPLLLVDEAWCCWCYPDVAAAPTAAPPAVDRVPA